MNPYVTRVLYTVSTGNVKCIEKKKVVNFVFGKEIGRDAFSSCHERG